MNLQIVTVYPDELDKPETLSENVKVIVAYDEN